MPERRHDSLISGAFAAMGGQALVYLLGIPTSILIARALGPDGRGEYYLPVVASVMVVAVFHLSLDTANNVAVSELRLTPARLLRTTNALVLVVAPVATLVALGFYFATRSSVFAGVDTGEFMIAAATVPVAIHLGWLGSLLVIGRRILRTQIATVLGAAVYLVAAAILYTLDSLGVTEVLILYGVSVGLPWLLQLAWSRELGGLRPAFDASVLRRLVGISLRFHPAHLTQHLLLKVDIFLVSVLLDVEAVGVYSIAVLVADPLWMGTNSLVVASVPFQLSRSREEAARLAFKAARFNLAIALAASAVIAATCWFWIPAVFGSGFEDSAAALALLLPGVCALAAARPFTILLPRTGRARRYGGIALGALALNCVLNVVLLPELGVIGASIASTVAYGLMAAAFVAWALRLGRLSPADALLPQPDDGETLRRILARLQFGRR